MNIWLEGADGTGKTTLAAALAKQLGVEALYHKTHSDLPEGQRYNVIDRHAYITNNIYKRTFPERFRAVHWVDKKELSPTRDDLFILLNNSDLGLYPLVHDYSETDLQDLSAAYSLFFAFEMPYNQIIIERDYSNITFLDYTTNPKRVRVIKLGAGAAQECIRDKVDEILRIVDFLEKDRH